MFNPNNEACKLLFIQRWKRGAAPLGNKRVAQLLRFEKVALPSLLSATPLPLSWQITEASIVKFPAQTRGFTAAANAAAAASHHRASLPVFSKVTADETCIRV